MWDFFCAVGGIGWVRGGRERVVGRLGDGEVGCRGGEGLTENSVGLLWLARGEIREPMQGGSFRN